MLRAGTGRYDITPPMALPFGGSPDDERNPFRVDPLVLTTALCLDDAEVSRQLLSVIGAKWGPAASTGDGNHEIELLVVRRKSDRHVFAVQLSGGTHPTLAGREKTFNLSDFTGFVRERIEAAFPGTRILYWPAQLTGATQHHFGNRHEFRRFGQIVVDTVASGIGQIEDDEFHSDIRVAGETGDIVCRFPDPVRRA